MDHHRPEYSEPFPSRTTLLWVYLESWMGEEYLWQVCRFMEWKPTSIHVPRPSPATGQQPANLGYCYLIFPSPALAVAALARTTSRGEAAPMMMPNSASPIVLRWAPVHPSFMDPANSKSDYSIFIADLDPDATEDDVLQVFRNPSLGQSRYRESRIIQPFMDCTSVKIMRDSEGKSRQYGFARFGTQKDRDRALREAPGLIINNRPVRIGRATSPKAKPPPSFPPHSSLYRPSNDSNLRNISAPIAAPNSNSSLESDSVQGSSSFSGSSSDGSLTTSVKLDSNLYELAVFLRNISNETSNGKYRSQSRHVSGDLIGPKGEWLASTDPYNTTVFVGGLTSDITEEMLWDLFIYFGPIYYVKVVSGKGCGFVQYVLKVDAARAIECMQGFPLGNIHLRLYWGHSNIQAAAAANTTSVAPPFNTSWTLEQLLVLLQKLDQLGLIPPGLIGAKSDSNTRSDNAVVTNQPLVGTITHDGCNNSRNGAPQSGDMFGDPTTFYANTNIQSQPSVDTRRTQSNFAPFSDSVAFEDHNTSSKVPRNLLSSLSNGDSKALPHPSEPSITYRLQSSGSVNTPTPTTLPGADPQSATYAVPYPITTKDRAVSRPDSKSSLDGRAEADLTATFTNMNLHSDWLSDVHQQQRQRQRNGSCEHSSCAFKTTASSPPK